jgi:hypothetical protein
MSAFSRGVCGGSAALQISGLSLAGGLIMGGKPRFPGPAPVLALFQQVRPRSDPRLAQCSRDSS